MYDTKIGQGKSREEEDKHLERWVIQRGGAYNEYHTVAENLFHIISLPNIPGLRRRSHGWPGQPGWIEMYDYENIY